MRFFQTLWRFLVSVQLLPALEGGEETLVGGQAVLEGVMMRTPHAWGITCRKPSGELMTHSEPLERLSEKHKWMGWPVVRGVMTLGHAMTLGFRALRFSANVQLDELQKDEAGKPPEKSGTLGGIALTAAPTRKTAGRARAEAIAGTPASNANPTTPTTSATRLPRMSAGYLRDGAGEPAPSERSFHHTRRW